MLRYVNFFWSLPYVCECICECVLTISTQDSATATPLTDLSAGSERSTLSRGGACFFNPSRGLGADDEGYQMELDDSYDRLVYMTKPKNTLHGFLGPIKSTSIINSSVDKPC